MTTRNNTFAKIFTIVHNHESIITSPSLILDPHRGRWKCVDSHLVPTTTEADSYHWHLVFGRQVCYSFENVKCSPAKLRIILLKMAM